MPHRSRPAIPTDLIGSSRFSPEKSLLYRSPVGAGISTDFPCRTNILPIVYRFCTAVFGIRVGEGVRFVFAEPTTACAAGTHASRPSDCHRRAR